MWLGFCNQVFSILLYLKVSKKIWKYIGEETEVIATIIDLLLWRKPSRGSWSQLEVSIVIVGIAFIY